MSQGYAVASTGLSIDRPRRKSLKNTEFDLTFTQKIKRKLIRWLDDGPPQLAPGEIRIDEESIQIGRTSSVRFEVHHATGGRVVQTRRYDQAKDRHYDSLYVITPEQDFGKEIDKILTMEALRT